MKGLFFFWWKKAIVAVYVDRSVQQSCHTDGVSVLLFSLMTRDRLTDCKWLLPSHAVNIKQAGRVLVSKGQKQVHWKNLAGKNLSYELYMERYRLRHYGKTGECGWALKEEKDVHCSGTMGSWTERETFQFYITEGFCFWLVGAFMGQAWHELGVVEGRRLVP